VGESGINARIESICGFEGRLAGTDAERRLANDLAAELESNGMEVEVEPTWVHPQWPLVHLLHCALAIAGSIVAAGDPVIGFTIVLVAAMSAYLDLSGRWYLLRRLLFRRASQNVRASVPGPASMAPRLILCANIDAPRTGAAYNPLPMRILDHAFSRFPVISSPTRIWFWSIWLLLVPIGARMAGLDASWVGIVQFVPTIVLIVACFLLGEIALSPASPGANANASGLAATLEGLRLLAENPPANLRVEAAFCGSGETTMQGMRSFVRTHRQGLDKATTRFISFESVGRGEPRFGLSQGLAVSLPFDSELIELCAAVAIAHDVGEDAYDAEPIRDGRISAAHVARAYGYRATSITCREGSEALPRGYHTPDDTPDGVDPDAVARAAEFAVEVVGLLDRDLARAGSGVSSDAAEPAATSAD
jgi:Peptidase family M28